MERERLSALYREAWRESWRNVRSARDARPVAGELDRLALEALYDRNWSYTRSPRRQPLSTAVRVYRRRRGPVHLSVIVAGARALQRARPGLELWRAVLIASRGSRG